MRKVSGTGTAVLLQWVIAVYDTIFPWSLVFSFLRFIMAEISISFSTDTIGGFSKIQAILNQR